MPVWKETIRFGEFWRDESRTFEQRRDLTVARFRSSRWLRNDPVGEAAMFVDELADAESRDAFDSVLKFVYDQADRDRVWLETIAPKKES